LKSSDKQFNLLGHRTSRRIHIEDPYDLKRNLNCVLGHKEEHNLRAAFSEGLSVVKGLCDRVGDARRRPVALRKPTQATTEKKKFPATHKAIVAIMRSREEAQTERTSPGQGKDKSEAVRMEGTKCQELDATVSSEGATITKRSWAILEHLSDIVCPQCEDDEDEELKWWYGFAFGCTAYCSFAVYSGQLFRLALAMSCLFFLLFCVERRAVQVGKSSEAAKARNNDFHKRHSRCRQTGTSGPPEAEHSESSATDRKTARRNARRRAREELNRLPPAKEAPGMQRLADLVEAFEVKAGDLAATTKAAATTRSTPRGELGTC